MPTMLIKDRDVTRAMIRERQRLRLDRHDEVWDGVYVMPSVPTNVHQKQVSDWCMALYPAAVQEKGGVVLPGSNVTDQPVKWKKNYRVPDIVVVLPGSKAVDYDTHFYWSPDFLIEIQTPGDDTDEKLPFYSKIEVRELLIVHRDSRSLRLYRHDGFSLALVAPQEWQGDQWLKSEVLALAFRRVKRRGRFLTEVKRTDGKPGAWVF